MNVQKLKKMIVKEWKNITFEEREKDNGDRLILIANVSCNSYDDDIRVEAEIHKSGVLAVTFVFDEIERDREAYELINEFNDKIPYLKAFITQRNDKDWLSIEYTVEDVLTEANGLDIFGSMMQRLISDKTVKYLKPLTKLTHGSDNN